MDALWSPIIPALRNNSVKDVSKTLSRQNVGNSSRSVHSSTCTCVLYTLLWFQHALLSITLYVVCAWGYVGFCNEKYAWQVINVSNSWYYPSSKGTVLLNLWSTDMNLLAALCRNRTVSGSPIAYSMWLSIPRPHFGSHLLSWKSRCRGFVHQQHCSHIARSVAVQLVWFAV